MIKEHLLLAHKGIVDVAVRQSRLVVPTAKKGKKPALNTRTTYSSTDEDAEDEYEASDPDVSFIQEDPFLSDTYLGRIPAQDNKNCSSTGQTNSTFCKQTNQELQCKPFRHVWQKFRYQVAHTDFCKSSCSSCSCSQEACPFSCS